MKHFTCQVKNYLNKLFIKVLTYYILECYVVDDAELFQEDQVG
jgi:hypothetical protein